MCDIGIAKECLNIKKPLKAWKVFYRRQDREFLGSLYRQTGDNYTIGKKHVARYYTCYGEFVEWNIRIDTVCGFWSFKTRKLAREFLNSRKKEFWGNLVVRKVDISGVVIEHEKGYRSKYMKIISK